MGNPVRLQFEIEFEIEAAGVTWIVKPLDPYGIKQMRKLAHDAGVVGTVGHMALVGRTVPRSCPHPWRRPIRLRGIDGALVYFHRHHKGGRPCSQKRKS